jgi:small-conductance mechanosensitive channel
MPESRDPLRGRRLDKEPASQHVVFIEAMLHRTILGNTFLAWSIAAGVAFLVGAMLVVVRAQVLRWLSARNKQGHLRRVGWALGIIEGTRPWFLITVAIFFGAQFVALPQKADRFVEHLTIVAVIVQGAFWASLAIRNWLARQVAAKQQIDAQAATTVGVLGFFAQLALWTLVVLLALENLGFNITTLLAGLGIGGVAMALAAQGVLGDIFASVTIALDKPFAIGDFITIDDIMGTVEHVGLKTTRLRSLSGEQIVLANSDLLKGRVRNFKRLSERRIEFSIGIAPDTPPEKLAQVPAIIRKAIEANPKTRFDRAHFKKVGEAALIFESAFYFGDPDYNRYMDVQQAINLDILRSLRQKGITLARPMPSTFVVNAAAPERGERKSSAHSMARDAAH